MRLRDLETSMAIDEANRIIREHAQRDLPNVEGLDRVVTKPKVSILSSKRFQSIAFGMTLGTLGYGLLASRPHHLSELASVVVSGGLMSFAAFEVWRALYSFQR